MRSGGCVHIVRWGFSYLVFFSSGYYLLIKGKHWLFPGQLFLEKPRGWLERIQAFQEPWAPGDGSILDHKASQPFPMLRITCQSCEHEL